MDKVQITGGLNTSDNNLKFESISHAINYLQKIGYTDYEISLVRFINL